MRIDEKKLADAIVTMAGDMRPTEVRGLARDVVELLRECHAIGTWRSLERAIERAWARRYGVATITIVSAHPLSQSAHETIASHALGAEIHEAVDDRLIGGAVVRADHARIDGSVAGALMRLRNAMYTEV